jgi:hypothetical protein
LRVELGEDLVSILGPGERLAALVPASTEPADRRDQLPDAGEVTAPQRLALDDRKKTSTRFSQEA